MKYRKKPVVIEAVQFTDETYQEARNLCPILKTYQHPNTLLIHGTIQTLEGMLEVMPGDFIVKGHTEKLGDHFWPVKPDYFEQNYEKVESPFTEFDKLRDESHGR